MHPFSDYRESDSLISGSWGISEVGRLKWYSVLSRIIGGNQHFHCWITYTESFYSQYWSYTSLHYTLSLKSEKYIQYTYSKLLHDPIFAMYSNIFTLFWLRKTSVIVKTYQLSFCVFICAFHPEISSFFQQELSLSIFAILYLIHTSPLCYHIKKYSH